MKDRYVREQQLAREPKIDIDVFLEDKKEIDTALELLNTFEPNNTSIHEEIGAGIYFHRLPKAVRILNDMVNILDESGTIGVELTTSDRTIHIFPTTIADPLWVKSMFTIHFILEIVEQNVAHICFVGNLLSILNSLSSFQ